MRTAIFLGLLYVGDAIRTISGIKTTNFPYAILIAVCLIIFAIMDVDDYFGSKK